MSEKPTGVLMTSAQRHLRPGGSLVTLDAVRHPGQSPIARLLIGDADGALEELRAVASARGPGDSFQTNLY